MTSWSYRKNGLIRKIRLISKFVMSERGYKLIAIQILPSISEPKSNQTMKLGQSIHYKKTNIFLQNLC